MNEAVSAKLAIIEEAAGWQFIQDWFPLTKQGLSTANVSGDLDQPGIYDVGLAAPIPQINGDSRIIYIGKGGSQKPGDEGTLKKSLDRRISNGSGVEKWLRARRPEQSLFARIAIAESTNQANFWEKLRFRWFIEQHWNFPIGNSGGVASLPMDENKLRKLIKELRSQYL